MRQSLDEIESVQQLGDTQELPEKVDKKKHEPLPYIPLKTPLQNIAICMSGGGFRAAAFALGTLSYLNKIHLNRKKLLDNVSLISSVSGGTITAAAFAVAKSKSNYAFADFFSTLKDELEGEKLLKKALEILNTSNYWKNEKARNLINSFAIAYDQSVVKETRFETIADQPLRVCFNATEFYRGLGFRFQNYGYMGNKYIQLEKNKTQTGKLKIADMIAASSCFPSGFEPLEFPRDFANEEISAKQLQALILAKDYHGNDIKNPIIPLMDGGINDNQGTTSATIADYIAREDGEPNPIDLFIITDVASYFMDPYKESIPTSKWWSGFTLNQIRNLSFLLASVLAISAVALIGWGNSDLKMLGAFLLFPVSIIGLVVLIVLVRKLIKHITKDPSAYADTKDLFKLNEGFSKAIIDLLLKFLLRLNLRFVWQMIKNRIQSVLTMVNDVMLKQVRRLIATIFYNNRLFSYRRLSNFIYDYSYRNEVSKKEAIDKKHWPYNDKIMMAPSPEMMAQAETAFTMPTTLWFDENDQSIGRLQTLITCGEFTICGNLLEYILDLQYETPQVWKSLDTKTQTDLLTMQKKLEEDWEAYKA